MPMSCEPVTAMLNTLFAAISCRFGTTDGTVTASVVPKNWLAVAKKMLIAMSPPKWSRDSRNAMASTMRMTFV